MTARRRFLDVTRLGSIVLVARARSAAVMAVSLLAVSLLAFSSPFASVRADELTGGLKKINDAGRVVIGYRDSSIPFSYAPTPGRPIGYSIDLCHEIVDDIVKAIGRDNVEITYYPVNSETRFDALKSGAIDLECGSTTANQERRAFADFSPVAFVSATRLLVPRGSPIRSFRDLGGRKVVVTAGTTNRVAIQALIDRLRIPITIVTGQDHADSFRLVKEGRADAFALDHVLLYGLIAAEGSAGSDYTVLPDDLSFEPYGIMFARDDPAMAAVVRGTFARLAASREIRWIYDRWFVKRLPTGQRLNLPVSDELLNFWHLQGLPD